MRKFRTKSDNGTKEENYWETATDAMAGILFAVVLVVMLLLLYITQAKTNDEIDPYFGKFNDPTNESYYRGLYDATFPTEINYYYNEQYYYNNEGGGGGEHETEDAQAPTQKPTVQEGAAEKTAVYVVVLDEESGNAITKEGISFELLSGEKGTGGLKTLCTYYPQKVEYKKFSTNSAGTFFLPERITQGWYSLRNLTAPDGYYLADNVDFYISEPADWEDPFIVSVKLSEMKSVIRVHSCDAVTGDPLEGAVYGISAYEDIRALDGTLHYRAGYAVDEVTCDEKGNGKSDELFAGKYSIRQKTAPEYYAVSDYALNVEVKGDTKNEIPVAEMNCRKTSAVLTLTDKFSGDPVAGAVYRLNGSDEYTTDENGKIELTDFLHNKSYILELVSLPEPYMMQTRKIRLSVDKNGLIDGLSRAELNETVYTVTLSVAVRDKLFNKNVAGSQVDLIDANGNVKYTWITGDSDYIIQNVKPGEYDLRVNGNEASLQHVVVRNEGELQNVSVVIWATIDLFALLMFVGALVLVILIIGFIVKRRRKARYRNG